MNCNDVRNKNHILHDGAAQDARAPFALDPAYVQIDERNYADWMVLVRDYARFVQYWDINNQKAGDWTPFWNSGPAIILASLASARVEWFREETRMIFVEIQKLENEANTDLLKRLLNRLFDAIASLARALDAHLSKLPADSTLAFSIRNLIQTELAEAFSNWIAWKRQAETEGLLQAGTIGLPERVTAMLLFGRPVEALDDIIVQAFRADWVTDKSADWLSFQGGITARNDVFAAVGIIPDIADRINFVSGHFFFKNTYETFLKAFSKIQQEAQAELGKILAGWNRHQPHYALFLAFLRLLNEERTALNSLTERHLRFYYERVLRLQPKTSLPARANILIKLARHKDTHLLEKGTGFRAGKDATGKDILFVLDEDFVANKAEVVALKTVMKAPQNPKQYQSTQDLPMFRNLDACRYFAAPVSNSLDGLGEELISETKQWHPFGNKALSNDKKSWDIGIPPANIGFAIASNYLYMNEGERKVTLTFNGDVCLSCAEFRIWLTGEKGWIEANIVSQDPNNLVCKISGSEPAVIPYQPEIHGGNLETSLPILKFELKQDADLYTYEKLKDFKFTSLQIKVEIKDKKSVAISGSTGPLDSSKPFHPFGPAPESGAVFILGDKELFQKRSSVTLKIKWKEKYDPKVHFDTQTIIGSKRTVNFQKLIEGKWEQLHPDNSSFLGGISTNGISTNCYFAVNPSFIKPDFSKNIVFDNTQKSGYVRFVLDGDWGHAIYPKALATYTADIAAGKASTDTDPKRTFDPHITEFLVDYDATETLISGSTYPEGQISRFFHLYPFGYENIEPSAQGGGVRLLPFLVPQYLSNIGLDGGEWYIGIKDLNPPQVLSLLIQVADGSADPLIEKPVPHLNWSYLRGNDWQTFNTGDVVDGTNELLQSGIVRFSMPREADTAHTILPAGLHWIRVSVERAVDAVCQIVGVHAQAASVTLRSNLNDPQLNARPLPAGSIAKLVEPVGAVKKIEQPYATFDGRPAETGSHFFTRVSERLRHKNRAVTLWDYERMILEAFPHLHKIKCLNHLRFEPKGNSYIYHELAPGHVTLIAISNVHNQNGVNPLRPYTSLGELKKIEAFLKAHTTCMATLHVRNPIFEPIKASFDVRFFPGYDKDFYKKLLNTEIIRFLSPWAFENGSNIYIGGKVYKSALINFIEERPYVDFIENFKLGHFPNKPTFDQETKETIEPSTLCSILVSDEEHSITVISDKNMTATTEDCGCI
jgi:hypothetical protein